MAGEVGDGGVNGGGSGESCGCGDTGGECQKSDTSSTSISSVILNNTYRCIYS